MPSLGEADIIVNSFRVGRATVLDVLAIPGGIPRLSFRLGIGLQDNPSNSFGSGRPAQAFWLHDLPGEVRLDEQARPLGVVHWVGRQHMPRSSQQFYESQVELAWDLDGARLEYLEDHRAGGEAIIWLSLWPLLEDAHGCIEGQVSGVKVTIPRDKWIVALGTLRACRIDLVEIPHPALAGAEFAKAVDQLRDAKSRVDRGDFDEAAVACRRALEGTFSALNLSLKAEDLEVTLAKVIDAERAKKLATIITRLKELGNISVHRSGISTDYLRAEAQFVVGCTAQAMALLARLFPRMDAG